MTQHTIYKFILFLLFISFVVIGVAVQRVQAANSGDLVSGPDGVVYLIQKDEAKHPFTSAGAFLSYEYNSFAKVRPGTSTELALPMGNFITPIEGKVICSDRGADKSTCYLVTQGQKAGFVSSKVFTSLGYSFKNTTSGDVSFMSNAAVIANPTEAHRPGSVVLDKNTYKFILDETSVLTFANLAQVKTWGNSNTIVKANAADKKLSVVGTVPTRETGEVGIWNQLYKKTSVVQVPKQTQAYQQQNTAQPNTQGTQPTTSSSPTQTTTSSGGGGGSSVSTPQVVASVQVSPASGTYEPGQSITLQTSTSGASIYYTLDGSIPTSNSTKYTGPFPLNTEGNFTLKTLAVKTDMQNSGVSSVAYTVSASTLGLPVFDQVNGAVIIGEKPQIHISTKTNATVYYTLDGTEPTTKSLVYTKGIDLAYGTMTVKAFATLDGYKNSGIASLSLQTKKFDLSNFQLTVYPPAGNYTNPLKITLTPGNIPACPSSKPCVHVYYTLDGTEPTQTSVPYNNEPISLGQGTYSMKVIAADDNSGKSVVSTFTYTISIPKPPGIASAASTAELMGITTVDAKYAVTNEPSRLKEGLELISELGSKTLGVWMDPGLYPGSGVTETDFEKVAESNAYKEVWSRADITTYVITAHSKVPGDVFTAYKRGQSGTYIYPEKVAAEKDEMTRFVKYLVETYPHKRFIITNWEGDWFMQGNYDSESSASDERTAIMLDWVNTRHEAILNARGGLPCDQTNVCDAVNINFVKKTTPGARTVLSSVVPFATSDLVGYSAWATTHPSSTENLAQSIASDMSYLKASDPKKRPIVITEIGFANSDSQARLQIAAQALLQSGTWRALYWSMTDNDCSSNGSTTCSGLSLVYPGHVKAPIWQTLYNLLH